MAIDGGKSAYDSVAIDYSKKADQLGVDPEDVKAPYGKGPGPKYISHVYHATSPQAARNIMKTGLRRGRPMRKGEKDHPSLPTAGRVWVSTSYEDADEYARGRMNRTALIKINRNHPAAKGIKGTGPDSSYYYYEHDIPPDALKREY